MPKRLREFVSNGMNVAEFEVIDLLENHFAASLGKLPSQLNDSRSFIIPCSIGNSLFDKVLIILDSNVNEMSLSVFSRLRMSEPQHTNIFLQHSSRLSYHPEKGKQRKS